MFKVRAGQGEYFKLDLAVQSSEAMIGCSIIGWCRILKPYYAAKYHIYLGGNCAVIKGSKKESSLGDMASNNLNVVRQLKGSLNGRGNLAGIYK